ncbi:MAG: hypothetical protein CBC22_00285, partial [Alphaproteobacteria bacterium TMED62]
MNKFDTFALNKQIIKALDCAKIIKPTPIQNKIIPLIIKKSDVLGVAQTGTGKTAAYLLPVLHNITKYSTVYKKKSCKSIVIVPTRELAIQVFDNLRKFSKFLSLRTCLIVGGVKPGPQLKSLLKGVDVLIGTPGRIMDHVNTRGLILNHTDTIILDEADQLMDLGFLPVIKKLSHNLPKKRQTILITATMLTNIKDLAIKFLNNYKEINLSPKALPISKIKQKVVKVTNSDKLVNLKSIIDKENIFQAIIFTRTKKRADNLAKSLNKNKFKAMSIHGDKRQSQRIRILNDFKNSKLNFLIATDVAARGLDIDNIMFVINYDLPTQPEIYVHRIGRTARAGKEGIAISLFDINEFKKLRSIEKLIEKKFKVEIIDSEKKLQKFSVGKNN